MAKHLQFIICLKPISNTGES